MKGENMAVTTKNLVSLDQRTILGLYRMLDEALKYSKPTVRNVYDTWKRRKEARGMQTLECEREEIIRIARVLKDNRLHIEATFMNGMTGQDKEEVARRAIILHLRYDYSPGDISRALDIPPDAAANIIEKRVTRPRNGKKFLELTEKRKLEAEER
ncbi:MAG: hypothetical protein KGH53_01820 [Candidatus Micrarchaeota archaeon]|nr:hypothetical protein [Candidatus Micrarchaeota archaeon]